MSVTVDHPTARIILLAANFLWFGAGFYQFFIRARSTFIKGMVRQPGDQKVSHPDHGADAFRYLGAMGGSLALSNLPVLYELVTTGSTNEATLLYLLGIWGAGHVSQALTTLTAVAPSGRWKWSGLGLGLITYIDLALTAANVAMWWVGTSI